jgi:hypothetical protein
MLGIVAVYSTTWCAAGICTEMHARVSLSSRSGGARAGDGAGIYKEGVGMVVVHEDRGSAASSIGLTRAVTTAVLHDRGRPRCLAGRERRREQTRSPSVCTTARAFQCAGTCQRDTNATTMVAPRSLRGKRCTRARSRTLFGRCFSPSRCPRRCSVTTVCAVK